MKIITFIILLLAISCTTNSQVVVKYIKDPILPELLMLSELQDLNELQQNIDKNLWVKVYKLPNTGKNECFPESHGICEYKYYIATSQLDDSPIVKAYYLGVLGEIIEYKWKYTSINDKAIINIITNKYSNEALAYNKALKNITTKYRIIATPNSLELTKIKP